MMFSRILLIIALFPVIAFGIDVNPEYDNNGLTAEDILKKADKTFSSNNYKSALDGYFLALNKAQKENDNSIEVEALAQIARTNLILQNIDEGKTYLEKARQKATDSDPIGWSRYLGVRGRFEWKENDLTTARATFEEMYDYCNTNGLFDRAVDAAHMVGIVAGTPEEQIEWNRLGIKAAEEGGVESWLGPLWNNLAGTYYDMKQYDSCLQCYLRARDYHWKSSGEVAKLYADYQVGMAYRLTGDLNNAEKWLRPSLAWAERLQEHGAIGQACEDLGEVAIARGKVDEGISLIIRARTEYKKAGYDTDWPEVWTHINQRLKELGK